MLTLQIDGYGVEQGIPTLVMAASSCDDVLSISLFGVFLGIAFSEGSITLHFLLRLLIKKERTRKSFCEHFFVKSPERFPFLVKRDLISSNLVKC